MSVRSAAVRGKAAIDATHPLNEDYSGPVRVDRRGATGSTERLTDAGSSAFNTVLAANTDKDSTDGRGRQGGSWPVPPARTRFGDYRLWFCSAAGPSVDDERSAMDRSAVAPGVLLGAVLGILAGLTFVDLWWGIVFGVATGIVVGAVIDALRSAGPRGT